MKRTTAVFIFTTISLAIISCTKETESCVSIPVITNGGCIDSTLIDSTNSCLTIYEPVCGCDGVTYGNACSATIWGGVTSYVDGECCE